MTTVIGLTGYAGVGKDTVANILVEEYGFTRLAFADGVRELTAAVDPDVRYAVEKAGWDAAKRHNLWVREALQNIGMACRDAFGEDFWVSRVADVMHSADPGSRFVVTDVRFPNEAGWIRQWGDLVRVDRHGRPVNQHVSETALDGYEVDYVIANLGDLAFLHSEVSNLMASLHIAANPR